MAKDQHDDGLSAALKEWVTRTKDRAATLDRLSRGHVACERRKVKAAAYRSLATEVHKILKDHEIPTDH